MQDKQKVKNVKGGEGSRIMGLFGLQKSTGPPKSTTPTTQTKSDARMNNIEQTTIPQTDARLRALEQSVVDASRRIEKIEELIKQLNAEVMMANTHIKNNVDRHIYDILESIRMVESRLNTGGKKAKPKPVSKSKSTKAIAKKK